MHKNKLSILIPVKNGMPYLKNTLEKIFLELQEIENYEVIVSENFSTDGTLKYLEELTFKNLKIVKPQVPLTLAENWNFVSSFASGEFIKLLCADDFMYPGALAFQIQILENYPEVSGVIGTRTLIDSNGRIIKTKIRTFRSDGICNMKDLMSKFWISGTNYFGEPGAILFRSISYERGLPFDDSFAYVIDLNFYFKCFANSHVYLSNKSVMFFRAHKNSLSSQLRNSQADQFYSLYKSVAPMYMKNRTHEVVIGFYVFFRSKINQYLRLIMLTDFRKTLSHKL